MKLASVMANFVPCEIYHKKFDRWIPGYSRIEDEDTRIVYIIVRTLDKDIHLNMHLTRPAMPYCYIVAFPLYHENYRPRVIDPAIMQRVIVMVDELTFGVTTLEITAPLFDSLLLNLDFSEACLQFQRGLYLTVRGVSIYSE